MFTALTEHFPENHEPDRYRDCVDEEDKITKLTGATKDGPQARRGASALSERLGLISGDRGCEGRKPYSSDET